MKTFVLDTHVLSWHLLSPKKIGKRARLLLREVDAGKAVAIVPSAVLLELGLLSEANRKTLSLAEASALFESHSGFSVEPLTRAHAEDFARLTSLVDPFDRMIVATARVLDLPLLTADQRISQSHLVDVIWD
ncbi:MAG: type II toxin-antitoxin system VapC family toxin [Polyangiaceae bacterium]|nr:type II toxin-antitoxin system VapC family toxin [Polyangiaceae bacterium]